MSEEELAAAIDTAVAEALASTEEATATTAEATADGTITVDETVTIEVALTDVEEAVALAETLIFAYSDVYGVYASEALAILLAYDEDLVAIAQAAADILFLLEQGSDAASLAIEQIEAALEAANASVTAIQANSQGWMDTLLVELDNRAAAALAVQATDIAANRVEAIQSAAHYVQVVQTALGDGQISQQELSAISLAGASASAGLLAQGGPQLQNLSSSIDMLTSQLARGEWPQAQLSLGTLESSLPSRP
jgi:hypothetical protein